MLAVAGREYLPVAQARAGDPDAWDVLFRRYQLPLYVYVHELVREEQASLDLVQETFIAAVRHLAGLRDDARFGSWLFSIARQKVAQRWRKPNRTGPLDEEQLNELPGLDDRPDDWLIRKEQQEEFMKLLHALPPPQREVLLLHFLEDFQLDEIATITGTALGTVKSRLHYAKRTLRTLLEERTP